MSDDGKTSQPENGVFRNDVLRKARPGGDRRVEHLTPAQLDAALAEARVRRAKALAERETPTDPLPSSPWDTVDAAPVPLIDEFNLGAKPEAPQAKEPPREAPPKEDIAPPPQDLAPPPQAVEAPVAETPNTHRMTIWLPERELEAEDDAEADLALPENIFFERAEPPVEDEAPEEAGTGYRERLKTLTGMVPVLVQEVWGHRQAGVWRTQEDRQHLTRRRAALVSGVVSFSLVVGVGLAVQFARPPAPETVVSAPPAKPNDRLAQVSQAAMPPMVEPVRVTYAVDRLADAPPARMALPETLPWDDAVGAIENADAIAQAVADAVAQALADPVDAPLAEAGPSASDPLDPNVGVAVSPRPMPRPSNEQASLSDAQSVVTFAPLLTEDPGVSSFAERLDTRLRLPITVSP